MSLSLVLCVDLLLLDGRKLSFAWMFTPWLHLQGKYNAMSDMHQIGLMIDSLSLWRRIAKPHLLAEFVQLLVAKHLTAKEAQCHQWISSTQT